MTSADDIANMVLDVHRRTHSWDDFLRTMAGYSWLGYSVEYLRVLWGVCEKLAPDKS